MRILYKSINVYAKWFCIKCKCKTIKLCKMVLHICKCIYVYGCIYVNVYMYMQNGFAKWFCIWFCIYIYKKTIVHKYICIKPIIYDNFVLYECRCKMGFCINVDAKCAYMRPSTVSKETWYSVKRDLVQCQKRPSTVSKET